MSILGRGSSSSLYSHPPTEGASDDDVDNFDEDDNDDEVDYSVGEEPPVRLLIIEPPKKLNVKKTYLKSSRATYKSNYKKYD